MGELGNLQTVLASTAQPVTGRRRRTSFLLRSVQSSTWLAPLIEAIGAALVLLFFVGFGNASSEGVYTPLAVVLQVLHGTWETVWSLVTDTLTGKNLTENYYGFEALRVWDTVRFILFALIVSCIVGIGLPVLRMSVRNRIANRLWEIISVVAESIPEPMYVIITVIVVVFLYEQYMISLPAFPVNAPRPIDTIIPGTALGLAGGFQLARMMLIRLTDETAAEYIRTAFAKGASRRQVFYRHILPNLVPSFILQLPTLAATILSSVLFAEYFFEYQGVLYGLVRFGFGEYQKQAAIPPYEPGYLFGIGIVLIGVWLLVRLLSAFWLKQFYPEELQVSAAPKQRKVNYASIIIGSTCILLVLVISAFPSLLTKHSATHAFSEGRDGPLPPYPPSAKFPFGTDVFGHDFLAQALHGTWATLFLVCTATLAVLFVSSLLAMAAVSNPQGWFSWFVNRVGAILSALPVLYLLLLAMHQRVPVNASEMRYLLWIIFFESGRGVYLLKSAYEEWFKFGFVPSATAIGRRRPGILLTHFRSWLGAYSLEFLFSEFARMMALMMMLAVYQVYATETYVSPMFPDAYSTLIIGGKVNTWFSVMGDIINNFAYVSYLYFLYATSIMLLLTMFGANLIARGIRGKSKSIFTQWL